MHIQHTALATAATTASLVACTITKIQGLKVAANDRFLQLHDTKATPSAAAVPVRVWPIYGSAPFGESFIVQPVSLSVGATFVVSSTANTYTASAETVDITVDGNAAFDSTGVSYVGDYTTGTESQEIWATGNGPKILLRVELTALSDGGTLYMKLYATSPSEAELPIMENKLTANTSYDFFFNTSPQLFRGALYKGCTIIIDNAPGGYTGTYAGSDYAIKGTYK